MKIKTKAMSYEQVMKQPPHEHQKPMKQLFLLRKLIWLLSSVNLFLLKFHYTSKNMDKLPKDQPCLILMNHSAFLDMQIIAKIFHNRPYQIVCTLDALVGMKLLMRLLGCIPTKKFITDATLVKDMVYAVNHLQSSVVMYPEASYSFDGTATTLPESLGKCVKLLKVPVVMVKTQGVFLREPLYNSLQKRKVKVHADVEYILSPEEIKAKSADELNEILQGHFAYDHFRWQQENQIKITEDFRADSLNRVLYKCPHCMEEGHMSGKGTKLTCQSCGKIYELTESGYMKAEKGETEINHIPAWYQWERECVRKELLEGRYHLEVPVDIYMMVNAKCVYMVGNGVLKHGYDGFLLEGCEGKLRYVQPPGASYSLYSDFYWYEIGDVVCVGDSKIQYYCVPKTEGDIVAKTRLAAEELYKITETARRLKANAKTVCKG